MADNQPSAAPQRSIDKGGIQTPVVIIDVGADGAESLWTGAGGGGAGGTEYTEDAAAAGNPSGPVTILVRADTPAAITSADGDNVAQRGSDYGAAYVTLLDTGGNPVAVGGGTQYTEGDTAAAIIGTAMLWEEAADTLVTVSASTPLPVTMSGVATEATLLAIEGDVDGIEALLTSIDGSTTTLAATDYATGSDVASLGVTGGGVELTALRVTLASDSTGVLSVDDNGGSLTVDGTVAVSNASFPVTDNGGSLTVDDGGSSLTVDGTVAVSNASFPVTDNGGSLTVDAPVATPVFVRLSDGAAAITALPVTDNGGNLSIDDGGNSITVDGTVAVTNSDLTTIAGAVKAEDAASANAHTGIPAMVVRVASPATTAGADGDYEFLQSTAGRLWVNGSGVTLTVNGVTAEDGALASNPVRMGVRAHTGVPTAMSADNDIVTPWANASGALVVIPQPRQVMVTVTPTISTSGYVNDDQVGGLMTFSNSALASGRPVEVIAARITSRTATALNALELHLFEASPTVASSDNAAFDLTDANLESARPFAVIDFRAADYRNTASGAWCPGSMFGGGPVTAPAVLSGSASIFGVLVASATPAAQYGGTTDLVVSLIVRQF